MRKDHPLQALVVQMLYSICWERLLMEEIDYNILFRWFVGLNLDEEACDATTFTNNREKLLAGLYLAGYISYESSYWFPGQPFPDQLACSRAQPLTWLGVYDYQTWETYPRLYWPIGGASGRRKDSHDFGSSGSGCHHGPLLRSEHFGALTRA